MKTPFVWWRHYATVKSFRFLPLILRHSVHLCCRKARKGITHFLWRCCKYLAWVWWIILHLIALRTAGEGGALRTAAGGGGLATSHTFSWMKSKRCSHNLQSDQKESCQRIYVLIMCITSKTIGRNKNMAVEGGTFSHYYILVIRKFIDLMSLFRCFC